MTAKFAELVFEVDPAPSEPEGAASSWFCRHCFSRVLHNARLRLSFCPVHGLGSELAPTRLAPGGRIPPTSRGDADRFREA